jgi:hypothetical protein
LLDDIEAGARVYLGRIQVSRSPAGIWRRFVRLVAARTIRRVIEGLRSPSEAASAVAPAESPVPTLRD